MLRRLIITLTTTGIAAAILLMTLSVDQDSQQVEANKPIVPIDLPTSSKTSSGPVVDGGAQFTVKTSDGFIDVHTDTYEPLPDGAARMSNLRSRIYGERNRVISVRGDHGILHAPDGKLRSGTLKGNIAFRVFSNPEDLRPGSPYERFRCFLEQVRFDRELGLIESPSRLRISTPRLELTGTSFNMNYSEYDGRIERLSGFLGGVLRLPAAYASKTTAPTAVPSNGAAPKPPTGHPGPPYYRATFHDDVVIRSHDTTIYADHLHVVFAQGDGTSDATLLDRISRAFAPPHDQDGSWFGTAGPASAPVAAVLIATMVQAALAADPRAGGGHDGSMLPHSDDDVTIAWNGRLLVEPMPQDDPHIVLVGGVDEALVTLTGHPVRIETNRRDVIRADHATYQTRHGILTLDRGPEGRGDSGVKIDSPSMGAQIRAPRIIIRQLDHTATVQGPGLIRALDAPGLVDAMDPSDRLTGPSRQLPSGLDITWTDTLELSFFSPEGAAAAKTASLEISALRDAHFRGNVEVLHPSFQLASDHLDIDMDPRTTEGTQSMRRIVTSGNVRIIAQNHEDENALHLEADHLVVHLSPQDDGSIQPTRLEARGAEAPLVARYGGRQLTAGILDVALEAVPAERIADHTGTTSGDADSIAQRHPAAERPALETVMDEPDHQPSPGPGTLDAPGKGPDVKIAVRLLLAEHDVRIRIPDEDTYVQAQRAVVDIGARRLELFGNKEFHARLDRPDGMLAGHYIEMDEASETMRVIGPGRAMFLEQAQHVLDGADTPPRLRNMADAALRATWAGSMHFDNHLGVAQFTQDAVLESASDADTARLAAEDIHIQFSDMDHEDTITINPKTTDASRADLVGRGRVIRSLEAVGNVVFLSEMRDGGVLATSAQIKGPVLRFVNVTETIQIEGPGSLVFLDERSSETSSTDKPSTVLQRASFRGTGRMLFQWQGGMTLDAHHNDMVIRDAVRMTHLPPGKQEVLMLDCQRLVADLEATGGMMAWMGQDMPSPEVRSIKADGDVIVINGQRKITTDHLLYNHRERAVTLEADPGWSTQVSGQPSLSARRMRWHLETDRFEIEDVGPGRIRR